MGLLGASRLGHILLGLGREVFGPVDPGDALSCGRDGLLGERDRIGTHVGDVTVLIESLGRPHGSPGTHPQSVTGSLLHGRGGEGGLGPAPVGPRLHPDNGEGLVCERFGDSAGLGLIHLEDLVLGCRLGQLPLAGEVLGRCQAPVTQLDHLSLEGRRLVILGINGRSGCQLGHQIPVGRTDEGHSLPLTLDNQPGGHGLDTSRTQAGPHLPPEHGREFVPVEAVQHPPGLLGIDHVGVHIAGVIQGVLDGLRGYLVEDHAFDGDLGFEGLHQVPGDGLPLAILISCQIQLIGTLQGLLQLGNGFLLLIVHDVVGLEPVSHIDPEPAVFLLLGGRHLRGLGQVTNMTDRGHDGVSLAQISTDLPCLGWRLNNDKLIAGCHGLSLYSVLRTPSYSPEVVMSQINATVRGWT